MIYLTRTEFIYSDRFIGIHERSHEYLPDAYQMDRRELSQKNFCLHSFFFLIETRKKKLIDVSRNDRFWFSLTSPVPEENKNYEF